MQPRAKTTAFIVLLTLALMSASPSEDQRLLQKSKSLIFDSKWQEAIVFLDEVISKYPRSGSYAPALFYKGKCLEETGDPIGALNLYQLYLKTDKNGGFKEDVQIAVIDISYDLYSSGKKEFLKNILQFLNSELETVAQYYAAFKLSYYKNKDIAKLGVPVLKEILLSEEDSDLKSRAKIALMRIDPSIMKDVEIEQKLGQKMIQLSIYSKEKKMTVLNIAVPLSLADLLLNSLDENALDIKDLKVNGADIRKEIIDKIQKAKSGILTFETEDVTIKVNIDYHK
jgi:tetratricopeptide (TPR) repeat protein